MWVAGSSHLARAFTARRRPVGFTLLELLVVISIIAAASAGVALALRDGTQTALDRDAQRLAVLFESARAQSRATGVAVRWQATADGFEFDGLADATVRSRWLSPSTRVAGSATVQLGPEPMIGAQAVELFDSGSRSDQQVASQTSGQASDQIKFFGPTVRIATDGLRPFSLQTAAQLKSPP